MDVLLAKMASDMPTFGTNRSVQAGMLRNDRIASPYFSHRYCSSPHAAEIWGPLVSTTLCADAADENRVIRPSTSVG